MKLKMVSTWFLVLFLLAACGTPNKPSNETKSQGSQSSSKDEADENLPKEKKEGEIVLEDGEGLYIGQIDNNSIEIDLNGTGIQVYRVTEDVRNTISTLKKEDKINFSFFKNKQGQFELATINKLD